MKIIGDKGEETALNYLLKKGFLLVKKNIRYPFGEIDLVMKDKNTLVFVEVRFRKNSLFGSPLETVNIFKQKKLIRAAKAYLQDFGTHEQYHRFDVVAITDKTIEHVEDAFWL